MTEVVVGGWKIRKAKRFQSRELRVTGNEIFIEGLPAIPLKSITNCKIIFTNLHLEFTENDNTRTNLTLRAPIKYHFMPFPFNYTEEREFVENLYDKIINNIPEEAVFWSTFKEAIKGLDADKIAGIKRAFARQKRRKHILAVVLVALTFSWVLFIGTVVFDLITYDEYEIIFLILALLIFPITIGYFFTYVNRCPNCRKFFISGNHKYCTRCKVALVYE